MENNFDPLKSINYLSNISLELLFEIAKKNLSYHDIMELCKTSKYFAQVLCYNPNFWWDKYIYDLSIGIDILSKAIKNNNLRIIQYLIQHGLHQPIINHALFDAIYYGHLDIIKYLIEYGASLQDTLYFAIISNRLNIIKYLIKQGARVSMYDIIIAEEFGNNDIINYLNDKFHIGQRTTYMTGQQRQSSGSTLSNLYNLYNK